VDCGSQHILDELGKLRAANRLVSIDHVFITHYHDDHTDQVARLVELFGASVLASPRNWEVLEHPEDHRLPCLTRNPIPISARVTDGARWRWKEFELRLFYFPGQTLYHDALLVKKDTGEEYFFIGDSFTPSGVDDYCLLNRNWLHDDQGFLYCLDLLKRSAPNAWLINQHVGPAFRFSAAQLEFMSATLRQRRELLRALLPWEDPNFGLDESWARFHPYAVGVRPGEVTTLDLRVMNHSAREEVFTARVILPAAWTVQSLQPARLRIPPNSEGAFRARIAVPVSAATGARLVTADLRWGDWDLREWTEALVQVRP
jgi:glyoxylase-like metal-dependent hydrolase (beta-lactamase superfamily II)